MKNEIKSYPVPPNSVYVWRGFMAPPPQTYDKFAKFLGNVFVPACALLQPKVGLRAYLPTMVPQLNKPAAVPDQTALMFWATPESHDLANGAIAVRIYQNLHGDAYDMTRSHLPEIPIFLPESLTNFIAEQPYYLFEKDADWMLGYSHHIVGSRPSTTTQEAFSEAIYKWAIEFKTNATKDIDATLVCCGKDYVAVWVHTNTKVTDWEEILSGFTSLIDIQLDITPRATTLPAGLWNKWDGLDLTLQENTSLNIQFKREKKTKPQTKK
jgi:hypothetical protein